GDNLHALKALVPSFSGKVKVIYIDPPYNTGNDFVYEDDFAESTLAYLERSGQQLDSGECLVANQEANGRFHSDWLSMMYSRLKLARTLLAPDGAIFVSIDDHERDSLKQLMDEVFGARCFVSAVIWRKKASPDARSTIGAVHDYLLCYVRDAEQPKAAIGKMALSDARVAAYTNPDDDPRGPWASVDMTGMTGRATKDQYFEVTLPSGRVIRPPEGRSWGLVERTFQELRNDNRIWFGRDGNNVPRIKRFLAEAEGQTVPSYWDFSEVGSNEEATTEVTNLFEGLRAFDTPKPVRLMRRLLEIATRPSSHDIVLDFFAGSASMAEAVMRANGDDGGNRRYVIVQIAEATNPRSDAAPMYKTVAAISRARLERVRQQIAEQLSTGSLDIGFRAFRIDSTNMVDVRASSDELGQSELDGLISSVKPDRTGEDLLFQVLLDWGLELTMPIKKETLDGFEVYDVEEGALILCTRPREGHDSSLSLSLSLSRAAAAIAERHPLRVVFLDEDFADDAERINVGQVFSERSPHTEVKTI
ncbi:MAG TPA: site-specific DNA-methyltransferase, partial [Acidimicrobiaceae bacterium]|nr:site-specific DNA-methyltransferase [Acidimicrobiaceae bacterium]